MRTNSFLPTNLLVYLKISLSELSLLVGLKNYYLHSLQTTRRHQKTALSLSRAHLGSVIAPNSDDIPQCMETVIGLAVVSRRQT